MITENSTKEEVLFAVKDNGDLLEQASSVLKNDPDVVLAAISNQPLAIEFASDAIRDNLDIMMKAVEGDGWALEFASERLKNEPRLVLAAIKKDIYAFKYASSDLQQNPDFIIDALKIDINLINVLPPPIFKDRALFLKMMALSPLVLQKAPEEFKDDKEIVMAAVSQNGLALLYASGRLKNDFELVLVAIAQNKGAHQYVSRELRDDPLIADLAAPDSPPAILKPIKELIDTVEDQEVKLAAVTLVASLEKSISTLRDSRDVNKFFEEIALAVNKAQPIFNKQQTSQEIFDKFEEKIRPYVLRGKAIINKNIWLAKLVNNEITLKDIPEEFCTDEICLLAIQRNWSEIEYVPKERLENNQAISSLAVGKNWEALRFIPEIMRKEALCRLAIEQDFKAFEFVPKALRGTLLRKDNTAERMLRFSYNPQHLIEDQETLDYLANLREHILKSCNIVILQPGQSSFELEDIRQVYAAKRGGNHVIVVRDAESLSKLLADLQHYNNPINLALIGHAHLGSEDIATMSPSQIAELALQNPIISRITLLGCDTAAGDKPLEEETSNAIELLKLKQKMKGNLSERYGDIFKNEKRLEALVNDILWKTGERSCGVGVMVEADSPALSEQLKQALGDNLDSAYILVKSKKDDTYAAYYVERDVMDIPVTCLSEKLSEEDVNFLKQHKQLTTGKKGNKSSFMENLSPNAVQWCSNKKGGIADLSQSSLLKSISLILNHRRERSYQDLPRHDDKKRSYKRSVEIDSTNDEFIKIKSSLVGKVVDALKLRATSEKRCPSVQFVKGYRGLLYPDKEGLISTKSLNAIREGKYLKTFFGTGESNINESAVKDDYKDAENKGTVKSVKVKIN